MKPKSEKLMRHPRARHHTDTLDASTDQRDRDWELHFDPAEGSSDREGAPAAEDMRLATTLIQASRQVVIPSLKSARSRIFTTAVLLEVLAEAGLWNQLAVSLKFLELMKDFWQTRENAKYAADMANEYISESLESARLETSSVRLNTGARSLLGIFNQLAVQYQTNGVVTNISGMAKLMEVAAQNIANSIFRSVTSADQNQFSKTALGFMFNDIVQLRGVFSAQTAGGWQFTTDTGTAFLQLLEAFRMWLKSKDEYHAMLRVSAKKKVGTRKRVINLTWVEAETTRLGDWADGSMPVAVPDTAAVSIDPLRLVVALKIFGTPQTVEKRLKFWSQVKFGAGSELVNRARMLEAILMGQVQSPTMMEMELQMGIPYIEAIVEAGLLTETDYLRILQQRYKDEVIIEKRRAAYAEKVRALDAKYPNAPAVRKYLAENIP